MRLLSVALVAVCAASLAWFPAPSNLVAEGLPPTQPASATIFLDAGVTDDSGRVVTTLGPGDFQVTVDGEPRQVVSLRFVYRGPGADTAAALADRSREAPAAAERTRSLLLLADENAIFRGQQKPVVAALGRMLDELGTADLAAVAALPRPPAVLVLTASAVGRQAAVARILGRAVSSAQTTAQALPQPVTDTSDPAAAAGGGNPDAPARIDLEREAANGRGRQDDVDADDTAAGPSIRALRGIIDGLAGSSGLKSVVVFRQAEWVNGSATSDVPAGLTSAVLASAARSRVVVHLVTVGQSARKQNAGNDEMRAIAAGTGGTIAMAKNASDSKALDAVRAAMWGGYLVEVEGRDSDRAVRPHAVKIESARPKTTVRAPGLWMPRHDPVPAVAGNVPPSPTPGATPAAVPPPLATPGVDARPPRRPVVDDPQLVLLLARLAEYLAAYVRDFGKVVAEEDYVQRLVRGGSDQRHLKSDLLLVFTHLEAGWAQYRDVFEVDGRPVRDREARVQRLFLENPADAPRLAREVSDESARFNVGTVFRNINTPTLPLEYLSPTHIRGLSFWRDGEETVEGIRSVRLAFEETARPTLVQPDNARADVPASGTYWIDPSSGRILKTRIALTAGRAEMTTTVSYKPAHSLGLWVPSEMSERYNTPTEAIEGHAVYRNFRSFNVTTEMTIK